MFDIGFSELLMVGLVAVVVLGPERLPGAVRVAGLWVGRLKRSFNEIKTQVESEIGVDDIRRQLADEHIQSMELEAEKQLSKKLLLLDEREALAPPPEGDAGTTDYDGLTHARPIEGKPDSGPCVDSGIQPPRFTKAL